MKSQLTIDTHLTEQQFMESLLNMKHSGVDENYIMICLSLYALATSWYFDKLIYYVNLLELKDAKRI